MPFAPTPIGPSLAAPSAGLLLTTTADALDLQRIARSDVALEAGTPGAEFVFWGDVETFAARIGVCTAAAALNVALGSAAGGIVTAPPSRNT